MIHPSGTNVYYEAEHLNAVSQSERLAMLDMVVSGLLDADLRAGNTAYWLARDLTDVPAESQSQEPVYDTETSHGKLPASVSLDLIKDTRRLRGFIGAIKRWPAQEGVIDVGCGSFPILALASALYHPRAEITAVEINGEAAAAAATMVDAFGLSDRVRVENTDIYDHSLEANTTAAVTETFNAGLTDEPGPQIVRLLHNHGVPLITPSKAELQLTLPSGIFSQHIDLRHDTHAEIEFTGWQLDPRVTWQPELKAEYYDDLGLVLAYDEDTISKSVSFYERRTLQDVIAYARSYNRLTYELGTYPFEPVLQNLMPSEPHSFAQ